MSRTFFLRSRLQQLDLSIAGLENYIESLEGMLEQAREKREDMINERVDVSLAIDDLEAE